MKKNFFPILISVFVFACAPAGVSEETKAAINQLEADLSSASEQLKALSDRFAASKDSAAFYCNSIDLSEALRKSLKDKANQADSLKNRCNDLVNWYETAGIEVATLGVQVADENQGYANLKEKISNNQVVEDSAKSMLQTLQSKLENSKMKMIAWNETLNTNDQEVISIVSQFKSLQSKK